MKPFASSDNPADADNHGMSPEVLQSSSWVLGPEFLRTKPDNLRAH